MNKDSGFTMTSISILVEGREYSSVLIQHGWANYIVTPIDDFECH